LATLAQSLASGHGLSSPFGGSTGPTALLSPGYPLFIAGFFRLFGAFSWHAAVAVMLAQLTFNLLTVLLIVRLTHQLFGALAADFAGFFWAVSPPLIWMPTIFWETCLSTLLLTSMVAIAMRSAQGSGALPGACTALAGLVNPALLPPLLAVLGWIAWQQWKTRPWYLPWAMLVFCLIYAPWPLRNARALHAFVPARSTVGLELWMGNHPGGKGFLDESLFPIFNRQEYDRYSAVGEISYMREKSSAAKVYVRVHPLAFLRLSALRVWRFWTGTGNQDGSILFAWHAVLTTVLGLAGVWRLIATNRARIAILYSLPLIVFPLPYYITHAEFRYRLVVDPLLTILAAHCAEKS
jgi:4-amino-4-deoxy-L-arabinose transferase-like glycosyltransferase